MGEVLGIIAVIAMILFNIIGIIRLGLSLDHPFLVTIAYIVVLVVIGNINGYVCLIVALAVAVISLIVCIIGIVLRYKEAKEEKQLQKEKEQRNNDLLEAVKSGDVEKVRCLIENGASINYKGVVDDKKICSLQIAIEQSNNDLVSLLIEKGAKINNHYGDETPLIMAIKKKNKHIVSFLISKGADVNFHKKKTPLDFAEDEDIANLLLSHGAKTKSELEAELAAEEKRKREEAEESRKKYQMQIMLNENLLTAIQKRAIDIVESLISQGADVNYSTMQGNTPLTFAISAGNMDILKLLLQNGADPNKKNHTLGGGEVSAVTFARYVVRDERLADFLEYY